jgi:hypothetical protein
VEEGVREEQVVGIQFGPEVSGNGGGRWMGQFKYVMGRAARLVCIVSKAGREELAFRVGGVPY